MKFKKSLGLLQAVLAVSLFLFACSSDVDLEALPEIAYGEVLCEQCGMIITEESHAAAYRLPDGTLKPFDDLGDMVVYHRINGEDVHLFWVHDFNSGEWMHADHAYFVATESLVTPMGHGIAAFESESEAIEFSGEYSAPVYRWNDLIAAPLSELPRHHDH